MYSNLKTTSRIKLKIFLWTKIIENLLLAKYLISVTAHLRSNTENPTTVTQEVDEIVADFLEYARIFCCHCSWYQFHWYSLVYSNCWVLWVLCDDYGHKIAAGVNFLKGHFLEKEKELSTTQVFKHSLKTTFFYSESILYPMPTSSIARMVLF